MSTPTLTPAGRAAHATFTALLNALSRPGSVQELPEGEPLNLLAAALLDLEASAYTPDETLRPVLAATGAPLKAPPEAEYLFFHAWSPDTLSDIGQARVGTPADPHRSATVILPAKVEEGQPLYWRGPGIADRVQVKLGGMDAALLSELLALRRGHRFPLGWDVIFVDGSRVLGLPRTTQVQEVN